MSSVSKPLSGLAMTNSKGFYEDPVSDTQGGVKGANYIPEISRRTVEGDATEKRLLEFEARQRKLDDYKREMERFPNVLSDTRRKKDMSAFVRSMVELLRQQHAICASDQPRVPVIFQGASDGSGESYEQASERVRRKVARSRRLLLCRVR